MFLNQKLAIILSLLTTLVAVNAAPQFIDFDAILTNDAPTPTALPVTLTVTATTATINTASAAAAASSAAALQDSDPSLAATEDSGSSGSESDASSGSSDLSKRAAAATCSNEKSITSPAYTTSPDDAAHFRSDQKFIQAADSAVTPDKYVRVGTDSLYNMAIGSMGWYGYNTLQTYDTQACANLCSKDSRCEGFNLYFERNPTTDPGNSACNNTNPPSLTNIKCILHSYKFNPSSFSNVGQFRGKFETAAAGSVAYLKRENIGNAPNFPGFGIANILNQNCTINAPLDPVYTNVATGKKYDTFIQSAWLLKSDPDFCYTACTQHTNYTMKHDNDGAQSPCNYFTTYQIYKNGIFYQTMCGLYTRDWSDLSDPSNKNTICTNFGQKRGKDVYTIAQSYDYTALTYGATSRTDLAKGNATSPDRGF